MSTVAVSMRIWVLIGAFLLLDLFALVFGLSFRREAKAARDAEAGKPATSTTPALSRRDFFRGSLLISLGLFFAEFGGATLAFLWPNLRGGFGSIISAGSLKDIRSQLESTKEPVYFGQGRFYVVAYNGQPDSDESDYSNLGVTTAGIMPLYQRCVHLGCRVPFCQTSKWFECPCHGSKYNSVGEYMQGPAPRGMDRFKVSVDGDNVSVDTSEIILGPPRGTNTIDQSSPLGAFCVAT